jgi:hypothetical protein
MLDLGKRIVRDLSRPDERGVCSSRANVGLQAAILDPRATGSGRYLPSVSRLRGAANHFVATISEAAANKSTIAPRYHSDKAIN